MSLDPSFQAIISNTTGEALSLSTENLNFGTWRTPPPDQIESGAKESFEAHASEGSAIGPEGTVVYQASDGTKFTWKFSVPGFGENSGGLTCDDGGSGACTTKFSFFADPPDFPTDVSALVNYTISAVPQDPRSE